MKRLLILILLLCCNTAYAELWGSGSASTLIVQDAGDENATYYLGLWRAVAGALIGKTDGGIIYNPSTGYLGLGKVPAYRLDIEGATTADSSFRLKCTDDGSFVSNAVKAGSSDMDYYTFGNTYSGNSPTTSRFYRGSSLLDARDAGGLSYSTTSTAATAKHRWYTGGDNLRGTLDKDGNWTFGDGGQANNFLISPDGDVSFGGTAGFIYGIMDVPLANVITVDTDDDADPEEVKDDGTVSAGDGWESAYVNGTTFAVSDLHYITVNTPGTYEVIWDMSVKTNSGQGTVIHGGITIDSTTFQRGNGEGHAHVFNNNDDINICAPGIVDCPNGDEEISLWISNDATQKTVVEHGNMRIMLIGGT